MECKHEVLHEERKRQWTTKDTLIIADCAICGSTITVGHEPHNADEVKTLVKVMKLIERLGPAQNYFDE